MFGFNDSILFHYIFISDPPTITKDPSNGLLKVNKGDSVTMACYGEGRPKPTVKWHRFKVLLGSIRICIK